MSSDVILEVVLHGCVSQPFVGCCLEEQENKNTPMMTLNLFIFEKNFEFLMKEHESLRGIKQNNLTHRFVKEDVNSDLPAAAQPSDAAGNASAGINFHN